MSREIRITIDDDEVFERMRRRKDERDLSWEEALRRGLDDTEPRGGSEPLDPFDDNFRERLRERVGREVRESVDDRSNPDRQSPKSNFDPFDASSIADFARQQATAAVQGLAAEPARENTLDSELDRLADAEDATLVFPFLEAEGATVPLRVTVETTGEGLAVEVVAVRSGKGTSGQNRFPDDARRRIAGALADGETATLELQNGAETYPVIPELSWGRTDDGTPTVTEVEISDVVLE